MVPELLRAVALPLGEAAAQQLQLQQQQGSSYQDLQLSSSSSISLECALSILSSHQRLGYQPSRSLLQALLPEYVRQLLDFAYLSSAASEDAARQAAMTRAAENAGEMLRSLVMSYRRLRQESITTEMLELIGGTLG